MRYGLPLSKALEFTAPSTGTYPVAAGPNCYNGADGPFAFAVTVTHGVAPQAVVALAKTATVPSSGAITATVQASGSPVTDAGLVLKLYGTWKGDLPPARNREPEGRHGAVRVPPSGGALGDGDPVASDRAERDEPPGHRQDRVAAKTQTFGSLTAVSSGGTIGRLHRRLAGGPCGRPSGRRTSLRRPQG